MKRRVEDIFQKLKNNSACESSPVIPIQRDNEVIGVLRVVSRASIKDFKEIARLATWRKRNEKWFPSQFRVTLAGTKRWASANLVEQPDRILFMIEDLSGEPIGHVGLYRFDFAHKSCEIDNVIRGKNGIPGIMTAAVIALCQWGKSVLGVNYYTLRVCNDNTKAIALYKRCGFRVHEDSRESGRHLVQMRSI